MTIPHRRILLVGIALEFLVTLVPSWTRVELVETGTGAVLVTQSAGFAPLFQPPTRGLSQSIDFARLSLMWIVIALACAFVWVWLRRPANGQSAS